MTDLDTEQLSKLLQNHRADEARALLEGFLKQPLSPEEKSAAHFALAGAYLELQNEISETYQQLLREAIMRLKDIEKFERQANDRLNLAKVKAEIDVLAKKA